MRRILEYELPIGLPEPTVDMPAGATILHAHEQDGRAFVWAAVDEREPTQPRWFRVQLTGQEALTDARYVGTCHLDAPVGGRLVVHIYDMDGVTP